MSLAKPLILCIEDEEPISSLISEGLEASGMLVQTFGTIGQILPFLKKNHVNLILLDVGLPDGSGFEALQQVREAGYKTPVIFLTANHTEADRVRGLSLGADDFVGKPFSMPELEARIRAVLRRTETADDLKVSENVELTDEPFPFCGCTVDPQRMCLHFPGGTTEPIGKKELGIMHYLASNASNVITRRALIHAVWGVHADIKSRSLDQYVVKIRNHLARHECPDDAFKTIHGIGYIYEPAKA
jgi:DNA-binding response OmpR family regulator